MSRRILLVEDDRSLRETLADALQMEGYEVLTAATGDEGSNLAFARHFDLLILDWMLPGRSGVDILKEVRAEKLAVPVLLLTVRNDENDKVVGLELGADDYVTKPFGLRELMARIKALLRRGGGLPGDPSDGKRNNLPERFPIGDAIVDLGAFQLVRGNDELPLSRIEAEILRLLYAEDGRAVSRNRFLDEVWGDDASVSNRTIDTHILHLRQKLESDPGTPRHLVTVHGVGYRLVQEREDG